MKSLILLFLVGCSVPIESTQQELIADMTTDLPSMICTPRMGFCLNYTQYCNIPSIDVYQPCFTHAQCKTGWCGTVFKEPVCSLICSPSTASHDCGANGYCKKVTPVSYVCCPNGKTCDLKTL